MSAPRTSGVNPDTVKAILDQLRIAHDEITKVTVDKPPELMFGGDNAAANALFSDVAHATKSLNLWLSAQSKALIEFGRAVEEARKAIENADDDSAASAKVIEAAVAGVTAKFSDLKGKDTRPTSPDLPGPLGALGDLVQTLRSEAQFDAGVNK